MLVKELIAKLEQYDKNENVGIVLHGHCGDMKHMDIVGTSRISTERYVEEEECVEYIGIVIIDAKERPLLKL